MMNTRRWFWFWLCGLMSGVLFAQEPNLPQAEEVETVETSAETPETDRLAYEQIARFTLAMEQIHRLYVQSGKQVDYEELIDAAIRGMTSNLDAHSQFLGSESMRNFTNTTRDDFGGVGVVINQEGEWVTVVSPIEGSPGWEAGLTAGDQILQIDGKSARGIGMNGVTRLMRGEPGSEVVLRIRRPSERKTFDVTLVRAIIDNPSVTPFVLLEPGVGYLRIKAFTQNTAQLLRRELTALSKQQAESLVLDLRGNPGGLLQSAVEVSSLFLPQDSLVVYTLGRDGADRKEYRTDSKPHRLNPRLVILINRGSASASEIVAAALRDHGRARLVGEKTFGKASVQSVVPLPDGSALKLTTATYHTPSDLEIEGKGVQPDQAVALPAPLWLRLRNEFVEKGEWKADPQISAAVAWLRDGEAAEEP